MSQTINHQGQPVSVGTVTITPKYLETLGELHNKGKLAYWNSGNDEEDKIDADYEADMRRRYRITRPWIAGLGTLLDASILHEVCCDFGRLTASEC